MGTTIVEHFDEDRTVEVGSLLKVGPNHFKYQGNVYAILRKTQSAHATIQVQMDDDAGGYERDPFVEVFRDHVAIVNVSSWTLRGIPKSTRVEPVVTEVHLFPYKRPEPEDPRDVEWVTKEVYNVEGRKR